MLVRQFQGLRAKPLHADDGDEGIRKDTAHGSIGLEVFKRTHTSSTDCWVSQQRLFLSPFPNLASAFVDVPRAIQLPRFSMPPWHQLVTLRDQRHAQRS